MQKRKDDGRIFQGVELQPGEPISPPPTPEPGSAPGLALSPRPPRVIAVARPVSLGLPPSFGSDAMSWAVQNTTDILQRWGNVPHPSNLEVARLPYNETAVVRSMSLADRPGPVYLRLLGGEGQLEALETLSDAMAKHLTEQIFEDRLVPCMHLRNVPWMSRAEVEGIPDDGVVRVGYIEGSFFLSRVDSFPPTCFTMREPEYPQKLWRTLNALFCGIGGKSLMQRETDGSGRQQQCIETLNSAYHVAARKIHAAKPELGAGEIMQIIAGEILRAIRTLSFLDFYNKSPEKRIETIMDALTCAMSFQDITMELVKNHALEQQVLYQAVLEASQDVGKRGSRGPTGDSEELSRLKGQMAALSMQVQHEAAEKQSLQAVFAAERQRMEAFVTTEIEKARVAAQSAERAIALAEIQAKNDEIADLKSKLRASSADSAQKLVPRPPNTPRSEFPPFQADPSSAELRAKEKLDKAKGKGGA